MSAGGEAAAGTLTAALEETAIASDAASLLSGYTGQVRAIGNLEDTVPLAGQYQILQAPNWTLEVNDDWIRAGIENNSVFYLASGVTEGTIWRPARGSLSVYGRELSQLLAAGYRRVGNFMMPPILVPH
jgi:hypothetical protein